MKIVIENKFQGFRHYISLEMINTSEIRIITNDGTNNAASAVINFTELYQAINAIATENQNK